VSAARLRLLATEADELNVEGIETLFINNRLGPGRSDGYSQIGFLDDISFVDGKQYTPPADVTIEKD
jgi:hypothetical protein